MLKINGVGRVTSPFDLVRLTGRDGEPLLKTEIPVACDVGRRGANTTFVAIVLWGNRAKAAAQFLEIGQLIYFAGDLDIQDYTVKNGPRAGQQGRAVKVNSVSDFSFGAKAQNSKGPACPALFKGSATSAEVVTSLDDAASGNEADDAASSNDDEGDDLTPIDGAEGVTAETVTSLDDEDSESSDAENPEDPEEEPF